MTKMLSRVCEACNRVHGVDGYNPRHQFRPAGTSLGPLNKPAQTPSGYDEARQSVVEQGFPFDPVLRQALIDKGVLTPDDLRNAEAKIMVTTGQFQSAIRAPMRANMYVPHEHGYDDGLHSHSVVQTHTGDVNNPKANDHTGVASLSYDEWKQQYGIRSDDESAAR
jgi:hypothetical protein